MRRYRRSLRSGAFIWSHGNLPEQLGHDPEEITRLVAPHLDVGRR